MLAEDDLGRLLAEQVAYYRALAPEYLDGGLDLPGILEIEAALDGFAPAGDVLELACGPGTWTPRLLQDATTVTAVDAAPEMLAIARNRVGDDERVCAGTYATTADNLLGETAPELFARLGILKHGIDACAYPDAHACRGACFGRSEDVLALAGRKQSPVDELDLLR